MKSLSKAIVLSLLIVVLFSHDTGYNPNQATAGQDSYSSHTDNYKSISRLTQVKTT